MAHAHVLPARAYACVWSFVPSETVHAQGTGRSTRGHCFRVSQSTLSSLLLSIHAVRATRPRTTMDRLTWSVDIEHLACDEQLRSVVACMRVSIGLTSKCMHVALPGLSNHAWSPALTCLRHAPPAVPRGAMRSTKQVMMPPLEGHVSPCI